MRGICLVLIVACLIATCTATVCSSNDIENAQCYMSDPRVGLALNAVAYFDRVHNSETLRCTGFLIGTEYFVTTHQCTQGVNQIEAFFQGFQSLTDCDAEGPADFAFNPFLIVDFMADKVCSSSSKDFAVFRFQKELGSIVPGTYFQSFVFPSSQMARGDKIFLPQFQNGVGMQISVMDDTSALNNCTITSTDAISCTDLSEDNDEDIGYVCDSFGADASINNLGGPIVLDATVGSMTVLGMHHCNSQDGNCNPDMSVVGGNAVDMFKISSSFDSCLADCTNSGVDDLTCVTTKKKRQMTDEELMGRSTGAALPGIPSTFISETSAHSANFNYGNVVTADASLYTFQGTGHYIFARTSSTVNDDVCFLSNPLSSTVLILVGSSQIFGDDFAISQCCGTVTGFSANVAGFGPRFFIDGFQLFVNGEGFVDPNRGELINQVATFSDAPGINGIVTERLQFRDVDAVQGFHVLTFLETFTNNGGVTTTFEVSIETLLVENVVDSMGVNLGRQRLQDVGGGFPYSTASEWSFFSTNDDTKGFIGILSHSVQAQAPFSLEPRTICNREEGSQGISYKWSVDLNPNESKTLMYFAIVDVAFSGGQSSIMTDLADEVSLGSVKGWEVVQHRGLNVINFPAPTGTVRALVAPEFDCGESVPTLPSSFDMGPITLTGGNLPPRTVVWRDLNTIGTFDSALYSVGGFLNAPKFHGGFRLVVDGMRYVSATSDPTVDDAGNLFVRTFPAVRMRGLDVSRIITLNNDPLRSWLRYAEVFENPTSNPITVDVSIATTLNINEIAKNTSSGDAILDTTDSWLITLEDFYATFPHTAWTFKGIGGPAPTRAEFSSACLTDATLYELIITFQVTIPAGERRVLIHFADPRISSANAVADASDTASIDVGASPRPHQLLGLDDFSAAEFYNFVSSSKRSLYKTTSRQRKRTSGVKSANREEIKRGTMPEPIPELDPGNFEIQVGLESQNFGYPRTSGVAMHVGADIVAVRDVIEGGENQLQVHVNGAPLPSVSDNVVVIVNMDGVLFRVSAFFRDGHGIKINGELGKFLSFSPVLLLPDFDNVEGLIGVWNRDPTDDLRSRDGIQTETTDALGVFQFGNSWMIQQGEYDLFNQVTFNGIDVFFDTNHNPALGGLRELIKRAGIQAFDAAVATCKIARDRFNAVTSIPLLRIRPENINQQRWFDSCVRDVILNNGLAVASDAEQYRALCVQNCNGRGFCVNRTCECLPGFSGANCEFANVCPEDNNGVACSGNGHCVNGFCQCFYPCEGSACGDCTPCATMEQFPGSDPLIDVSFNEASNSVEVVVEVPFLRDFASFWADFSPFMGRGILDVNPCENRNIRTYNSVEYMDSWASPVDANAPEALNSLRYPAMLYPNKFWTVEAIDCGHVRWTGRFPIDDLGTCTDQNGNPQFTIVTNNAENRIEITGQLAVTRVVPMDVRNEGAGLDMANFPVPFTVFSEIPPTSAGNCCMGGTLVGKVCSCSVSTPCECNLLDFPGSECICADDTCYAAVGEGGIIRAGASTNVIAVLSQGAELIGCDNPANCITVQV